MDTAAAAMDFIRPERLEPGDGEHLASRVALPRLVPTPHPTWRDFLQPWLLFLGREVSDPTQHCR